ncbi:MAG: c-type cytochrome [Limisphaerales bacterium]
MRAKQELVAALVMGGLLVAGLGTTGLAAPPAAVKPGAKTAAAAPAVTYLQDVLPIFMGKCARCHSDQERLLPNWDDYKTAHARRMEIKRRIWDAYKGEYYKQPMPAGDGPEARSLTERERQIVREWVEEGAPLGTLPKEEDSGSKPQQIQHGKQLFAMVCTPCHQATGLGIPDRFPPLAGSDFLNGDKARAVKVLLHGRQGNIVVNGKQFNNSMPKFPLSDTDIANVLTYVYNSFGNSGKQVLPNEVKALRAEKEPEAPRELAHSAPEKPNAWE